MELRRGVPAAETPINCIIVGRSVLIEVPEVSNEVEIKDIDQDLGSLLAPMWIGLPIGLQTNRTHE